MPCFGISNESFGEKSKNADLSWSYSLDLAIVKVIIT